MFNKKGLLSIEYLLLYGFLLIAFLLIITIQFYTLYRTFIIYDILRVVRLESIEKDSLYMDIDIDNIKNRYEFERRFFPNVVNNDKIYIGTLVEYLFNKNFLKFKKIDSIDDIYQKYELETSLQPLPFFKIENQVFYLLEPKSPDGESEHITKSCSFISNNNYNNYIFEKCNCP